MARIHGAKSVGSVKRILIDKSNGRIVAVVSFAAFAVIFSLVAAKTLWNQASYQGKVISKRQESLRKLEDNIKAMDKLKPSYDEFVARDPNAIGGNTWGAGPKDGDNAKIVLDALPSKYDFPALATNLETIVNDQGIQLSSISGTDDEIAQSSNVYSPNPEPVEMPFQIGVTTDYVKVQDLVKAFERSIRPLKINDISISGSQGKLSLSIDAVTYYQPSKSLQVRTEVVK